MVVVPSHTGDIRYSSTGPCAHLPAPGGGLPSASDSFTSEVRLQLSPRFFLFRFNSVTGFRGWPQHMPKAVTPRGLEPRPLFRPVFLSHSLCCLPVDRAFVERRDGDTGPSPRTCVPGPCHCPVSEVASSYLSGQHKPPLHHRPQMRCLIDIHINIA